MYFREDNTYNEIREKSMMQWLNELAESNDIVNRGGARLTLDYLDSLNRKIQALEDENALKEKYMRKMKEKMIHG